MIFFEVYNWMFFLFWLNYCQGWSHRHGHLNLNRLRSMNLNQIHSEQIFLNFQNLTTLKQSSNKLNQFRLVCLKLN